jgi:hypothetical protein
MNDAAEQLPDDLASALTALAAERARCITAEAEAATAKAEAVSHSKALIARLKLEIEKVRRELYGSRSEREARLLEQMELQLEELDADAGEDELAAEMVAKGSTVRAIERKRPSRKPFPEHLPRERVVIAAPTNCSCCGSAKLLKLGEDITDTLEPISPMALEAVKRIDALFDVEREINGLTTDQRLESRHKENQSLVEELHGWLQAERVA